MEDNEVTEGILLALKYDAENISGIIEVCRLMSEKIIKLQNDYIVLSNRVNTVL